MYQHDFFNNNSSAWGEYDDVEPFNVNTSIQEIQAYSTNLQRSKYNVRQSTFLPSTIYENMDDQSRSAWSKMDPNVKAKIIKSMSSSNQSVNSSCK